MDYTDIKSKDFSSGSKTHTHIFFSSPRLKDMKYTKTTPGRENGLFTISLFLVSYVPVVCITNGSLIIFFIVFIVSIEDTNLTGYLLIKTIKNRAPSTPLYRWTRWRDRDLVFVPRRI
jgi:hypothetical protein